jgi:hypothetical protein
MTIQGPFKRTVRPFRTGDMYPKSGQMAYVLASSYSSDPKPYVRGFLLIQREIRNLFEFIHPSDENLGTYSEHIGVLLVRACFEVETNLKAVMRENGYASRANWNMRDYKKVEHSHKLSGYEVLLPEWTGGRTTVSPFRNWSSAQGLDWYTAYNKFKHDRVANLAEATFKHLIDAWCGLFTLLSAQYYLESFSVEKKTIGFADTLPPGEFWHGIGDYLSVKFPVNWQDADRYDFVLTAQNFSDPNFAQNFQY